MKIMTSRSSGLAAGVAAAALICGCAGAAPLHVDAVHTSAQCPLARQQGAAAVQVIGGRDQWVTAFGDQAAEGLLGRPVDWSKERVIVFTLGQRPNLGHGVSLASNALDVEGEVLRVPVTVRQPAPDAMVAMALAYPCVIAAVPSAGWAQVKVVDAQGKVLATSAAAR
jgi:hypothetical protein